MFDLPKPNQLSSTQKALSVGEGASEAKLNQLLATRKQILTAKSQKIHFAPAILFQDDNPVIFPRTINVIQGKAGVHKSRLAETICGSLLKRQNSYKDLLGFKAQTLASFNVCYVDTERNLSDQLPYALQQIQIKAGYAIEDKVPNFDCISLLEFGREERFEVLDMYLEHIRNTSLVHTFIVLDVITDCVYNFNDPRDSMRLIDMMNRSINRYDITFLCLIHENPGSVDKARGHLGTELTNKASTIIQIGYEEMGSSQRKILPAILKVDFLKCRSTARHEPFYVQYSELENGLVWADVEAIKESKEAEKIKQDLEPFLETLGLRLQSQLPRKELFKIIAEEHFCSDKTTDRKLKEIMERQIKIVNLDQVACILKKEYKSQEMFYFLEPECPF